MWLSPVPAPKVIATVPQPFCITNGIAAYYLGQRHSSLMSRNRQTVFIPEAEVGQAITSPSLTSKPTFRTEDAAALSISHKSPWEYYEKRFPMKFWCSFAIITSKPHRGGDPRMMRTLTGAKSDEQLQIIRHIFHRNIVQNIELFASGHEPGSYFIVSEYMPTSLSHLYGCPEYPSEPAFSSILYQVRESICIPQNNRLRCISDTQRNRVLVRRGPGPRGHSLYQRVDDVFG